jgi:AcrR family transcriptional regulator
MTIAQVVKKDTKAAILDAAEIEMAENGVESASMRAIVVMAGANTAAIHYHFNSREGLVEAILGRRGDHVSGRRLEMIQEFDRSGCTPTPMDVVNFLVDPMIDVLEQEGEAGRRWLRFLARLQSDRKCLHILRQRERFPEVRIRLRDIIKQSCPDLSEAETNERLTMLLDTMLQSFANAKFMSSVWESDEIHDELSRYTMNLKSFLAGGLAAPITI